MCLLDRSNLSSFKYFVAQNLSPPFAAWQNTAEEDVAHFPGNTFGVGVHARVMPSVNPIHHAKQAEYGDAAGKLQFVPALKVIEQSDANPIVFALYRGQLGGEAVFQDFGLVGQHLHGSLVSKKVFQMIQNENANALFRIVDAFET